MPAMRSAPAGTSSLASQSPMSALDSRTIGRRRTQCCAISAGYAVSNAIVGVLKPVVGRHRPDSTNNAWRFDPFSAGGEWHSFPSSHAVHAFSLAAGAAIASKRVMGGGARLHRRERSRVVAHVRRSALGERRHDVGGDRDIDRRPRRSTGWTSGVHVLATSGDTKARGLVRRSWTYLSRRVQIDDEAAVRRRAACSRTRPEWSRGQDRSRCRGSRLGGMLNSLA